MEGYESLIKVFHDRGLPGVVEALDEMYKDHEAHKKDRIPDQIPPPFVPPSKEVTLG